MMKQEGGNVCEMLERKWEYEQVMVWELFCWCKCVMVVMMKNKGCMWGGIE